MGSKTIKYYAEVGKAICLAAEKEIPIKNIKEYAGDRFGIDIYLEEWEIEELVKKMKEYK